MEDAAEEFSEEDAPDLVGTTLPGGWEVNRHIGEGAMALVYEAKGPLGGPERVAVKVMHSSLLSQPEVSFRFRLEAELLETIDSPHVPKLYGRGKDDKGRPFLVMELVEGTPLSDLLRETTTMPYARALDIVTQICRALAVAHDAGVVHRDMKPSNVIVGGTNSDPVVKVLDFSVSKKEDLAFTRTGVVLGTPAYMPPEQAYGEVSPLVDVYAVGAILYDMLVGRPPYEGAEPGKVLSDLLKAPPPAPRELAPHLSVAAESLILKAIAREPANRYPTMDALMDAIAELRGEASRLSSVSTMPPPPLSAGPRSARAAPPSSRRPPIEAVPPSSNRVVADPVQNAVTAQKTWWIMLAVAIALAAAIIAFILLISGS